MQRLLNRVLIRKVANVFRLLIALLIVLTGVLNIANSFPFRIKMLIPYGQFVMLNHVLSSIIGFILIFVGIRLYKRMRMAYSI